MKLFIGFFTFLTSLLAFAKVILFIAAIAWLCIDPYGFGNTIGSFVAAIIRPIISAF